MKIVLFLFPVFVIFFSCKKDISEQPPSTAMAAILKYNGTDYLLHVYYGFWRQDGNLASMGFSATNEDGTLIFNLRAYSTETTDGIGTYGVYEPQIKEQFSLPMTVYTGKDEGIIPGTDLQKSGDLIVIEKDTAIIKGTFTFTGENNGIGQIFSGSFNYDF